MGAIAAVISKKNENVAQTAVTMLRMLKHKDNESFGLASPTIIQTTKSIEDLHVQDTNLHVLIGHVFSRTLRTDRPQPMKLNDGTLVFEGRIHLVDKQSSDAESAAKILNQDQGSVEVLIKDVDGDFVLAVAESGRLLAGRDTLGVYPLYYGENSELAALASERKALWKIGIKEVNSFPPGHTAIIDNHGFEFKPVKTLAHTRVKRTTMQAAAKKIQGLLQQSVKQKVSRLKEVAVAFSGGLDSSIIAFLAKNSGVDVHLIFVSLRNQPETEEAEEAAEALDIPFHPFFYSEENVKKILPKVLWLIEEPSPVKASVGIPVFWTAEKALDLGCSVMLAGQGADELFGGYKRYANDYLSCGEEFARQAIVNDIIKMYEINFERDFKICNSHSVELRLPFATYRIAEFAATLPLQLKIESPSNMLRKTVLRKVAEDIGLPQFIVKKPKRAIQYATGVNRTIKKLARKEGFSTREYLQKMFQTVFEKMM